MIARTESSLQQPQTRIQMIDGKNCYDVEKMHGHSWTLLFGINGNGCTMPLQYYRSFNG
jgi:hypothetical protein